MCCYMDALGAPKVAWFLHCQATCTPIYDRIGSESTAVSNYYIPVSRRNEGRKSGWEGYARRSNEGERLYILVSDLPVISDKDAQDRRCHSLSRTLAERPEPQILPG